jgi:hypothetical protein
LTTKKKCLLRDQSPQIWFDAEQGVEEVLNINNIIAMRFAAKYRLPSAGLLPPTGLGPPPISELRKDYIKMDPDKKGDWNWETREKREFDDLYIKRLGHINTNLEAIVQPLLSELDQNRAIAPA